MTLLSALEKNSELAHITLHHKSNGNRLNPNLSAFILVLFERRDGSSSGAEAASGAGASADSIESMQRVDAALGAREIKYFKLIFFAGLLSLRVKA